jgi:hypothetical protein
MGVKTLSSLAEKPLAARCKQPITRYWAWYPADSPDLLVPLPSECEDDDYQIQTDPVKPPVFIFNRSASWAHSGVLKGYDSVSLSSLQQILAVAADNDARKITLTFACDVSSNKTPESSIPRSPFTWMETIEADPSSAQPGSSAGPHGEEDTPVTSFTFILEDGEGEIPVTGFTSFVCENHFAAMASARRTSPTRTATTGTARSTTHRDRQEYDSLNDITDAILQDSEMEESDDDVTGASGPLL